MKYYKNIVELIGCTPLIKLNNVVPKEGPLVLAKTEFLGPGGSVKDRIGVKMLLDAEKNGLLKEGGTVIEPTSGNTGVGLAMVCVLHGYKMVFTMPDKMSKEKETLLGAFGGRVIRTPTAVAPDDPNSYYKVADRLIKEKSGSFCPNQYFNQNNPLTHHETTGPEIWNDTDGNITHFVAGMGTGGTITGVGRYLKEQNPEIKIIGVDPEGSIFFNEFYGLKGEIHTYKTEGIGEDFIPKTIDLSLVDEVIRVSDRHAFLTARALARQEGILVGSSSGAAVYAAIRLAERLGKDAIIVVLLPDTGRNYLSKIFDDEWMIKNGFL